MAVCSKAFSTCFASVVAASALVIPSAAAVPPSPGTCQGQWEEYTSAVNPENPDFFDQIDVNDDGIICMKDWVGPDPDPEIGFIANDNVARHRNP
jgi:hypothetical protein